MQMIGHDAKGIQLPVGEMVRDGMPAGRHNLPNHRETKHILTNIGEDAGAIAGTDGDEVGAGLGVVIATEADGPAVVSVRVVAHDWAAA